MSSSAITTLFAAALVIAQVHAYDGRIAGVYQNVTDAEMVFKPNSSDLAEWGYNFHARLGIRLQIGTPPQTVYITPSVLFTESFVRDVASCEPETYPYNDSSESYWSPACEGSAEGLFVSNKSSSFSNGHVANFTNPLSNYTSQYTIFVNGTEATDNIKFPDASPALSLSKFGFVAANAVSNPLSSRHRNMLGLGKGSAFLKALGVSRFSWTGLYTESPDDADINPDYGLQFGQYKDNSKGQKYTVKITDEAHPLTMTVTQMKIHGQVLQVPKFSAYADLYQTMRPMFPKEVFYALTNVTNMTYGDDGDYPSYFSQEVVPTSRKDCWNLTITLDNGYTFNVSQQSLVYNIDGTGYPYRANSTINFDMTEDRFAINRSMADIPYSGFFPGFFFASSQIEVDYDKMEYTMSSTLNTSSSGSSPGNKKNNAGKIERSWAALAALFIGLHIML